MSSHFRQMVPGVRIYWSADAIEREPGTHKGMGIKTRYDALCQRAIDLRLATAVVFLDSARLAALAARAEVVATRPRWYPANRVGKPKHDLLRLKVGEFDRSWLKLRLLAEPPERKVSLWASDPALVFDAAPGVSLCRMASVGHEGQIFFFAYPNERQWGQVLLAEDELSLFGTGEDTYRKLLPEPGQVFGGL